MSTSQVSESPFASIRLSQAGMSQTHPPSRLHFPSATDFNGVTSTSFELPVKWIKSITGLSSCDISSSSFHSLTLGSINAIGNGNHLLSRVSRDYSRKSITPADAVLTMYQLNNTIIERQQQIRAQLIASGVSSRFNFNSDHPNRNPSHQSYKPRIQANRIASRKEHNLSTSPRIPSSTLPHGSYLHRFSHDLGDEARVVPFVLGEGTKPMELRIIYVASKRKYYLHTTVFAAKLSVLGLSLKSDKWMRDQLPSQLEIRDLPLFIQNGRKQLDKLVQAAIADIYQVMESGELQLDSASDKQCSKWQRMRTSLLKQFQPFIEEDRSRKPFHWITDVLQPDSTLEQAYSSSSEEEEYEPERPRKRIRFASDSHDEDPIDAILKATTSDHHSSGSSAPDSNVDNVSFHDPISSSRALLDLASSCPPLPSIPRSHSRVNIESAFTSQAAATNRNTSQSTLSLIPSCNLSPSSLIHTFHKFNTGGGDYGCVAFRSVSVFGFPKIRYELHLFFIGMSQAAVVMEEDEHENDEEEKATDEPSTLCPKLGLVELDPLIRCIHSFQFAIKAIPLQSLSDLTYSCIQAATQSHVWCIDGIADRSFPKLMTRSGALQSIQRADSNEATCVTFEGIQMISEYVVGIVESSSSKAEDSVALAQFKSMIRNLTRDVETSLNLAAQRVC